MAGHFLQTDFWARFKAAHGWEVSHSAQGYNVLLRHFKKGPLHFTLAYVPMAPEGGEGDAASCAKALTNDVRSAILPRDTICVRFDVPYDFATAAQRDDFVAALRALHNRRGLRAVKSAVDVQPPDTVLLNLTHGADKREDEELLAAMKSKWRYNIRLAQKKGVVISAYHAGDDGEQAALDVFYRLYEATAARDKIAIHPKQYYADLLTAATGGEAIVTLYVARHEGDEIAAIITIFTKSEATYLYGASGNVKRNLMATYLLQWQAIKDAKQYGSAVYDFYGIPPTDDKNHPMAGLYLFKTGFGGREVHRPGSIDVPTSRMYALYTAAERARSVWYKKIKKATRR